MYTIWKTKKPLTDNKSDLVAQTKELERAKELALKLNQSELKKASEDGLTVKGNREITEVFTKQEILDVIESFKNGQIAP